MIVHASQKPTFARAPLRLGLAGGGSDIEPFCSEFGGRVINATISKFVHSKITNLPSGTIFTSQDQHVTETYLDTSPASDTKLLLHRNAYEYFCDTYLGAARPPIHLETYTDAPVGSGLGTSSTLVVSIVAGLARHFHQQLDTYAIAAAAQTIERVLCGFAGGRQDSFSATFGGFNFMEFERDSNIVNQLKIPRATRLQLESTFLLYHMGTSRLSAKIIDDQSKTLQEKNAPSWDAMMRIRNEAEVMKNFLLTSNMEGVVDSLRQGWSNKKATSGAVSNQFIDEIYDAAIRAGASAGKVSGAGGGGFMLFYVDVSSRLSVINELKTFGGFTENVEFTTEGVESWTHM